MEMEIGATGLVVLTGATGFIGKHLLPVLLGRGHRVRAVSRRGLGSRRPSCDLFEEVCADLGDEQALERVLSGARVAIYLVHSMEGGVDEREAFARREEQMALGFGRAAARQGVEHIIYLGGLQSEDEEVSEHLRSRAQVERALAKGEVSVTTLRAGFIIGPGSAAFEMLRALTDRMRLMMIPPQLEHVTQPSCIEDVVDALVSCVEQPERVRGETLDVGMRERMSYFEIVELYRDVAGRDVQFLRVPWAPRQLSAVYVAAISGLSFTLVAALSEGMEVDLTLSDERLYELFPSLSRSTPREAMERSVRASRA
jgi:uncharacterized protein YbjT (DUF2867 family)